MKRIYWLLGVLALGLGLSQTSPFRAR
ncbi:MAG: sulfur oxidation c-type cytochrome SoxX, partial [Thermus sp.]